MFLLESSVGICSSTSSYSPYLTSESSKTYLSRSTIVVVISMITYVSWRQYTYFYLFSCYQRKTYLVFFSFYKDIKGAFRDGKTTKTLAKLETNPPHVTFTLLKGKVTRSYVVTTRERQWWRTTWREVLDVELDLYPQKVGNPKKPSITWKCDLFIPIGSTGLVYSPTFTRKTFAKCS